MDKSNLGDEQPTNEDTCTSDLNLLRQKKIKQPTNDKRVSTVYM
jgi:hypothetical protein